MKCKQCYTVSPKPHYRTDKIDMALVLYTQLHSYRKVARLLGVHHQTVINWVRDRGFHLSLILDRHPLIQIPFDKRVKRLMERA
jgi:transposase-like protein